MWSNIFKQTFASFFVGLIIMSFSGEARAVSSWDLVNGTPAGDGINYNPGNDAFAPFLQSFNGDLYATWEEVVSGYNRIQVGKYNGNDSSPSWTVLNSNVNGSSRNPGDGINRVANSHAFDSALAVYNGSLYASWRESSQIRVARYDDSNDNWVFVDGNHATRGINYSWQASAGSPEMIVFDGKLLVAWREASSFKGKNVPTGDMVVAKFYDGSSWSWASNPVYFNYVADKRDHARGPSLAVLPGSPDKLHIFWSEQDGGGSFLIRAKAYNGGTSWSSVDGGGLNFNSSYTGQDTKATVFNSEIYLTWLENSKQIRLRSYDGATWTWRDGGTSSSAINVDPSQSSYYPNIDAFSSSVYVTWGEYVPTSGNFVSFSRSFDGSSWSSSVVVNESSTAESGQGEFEVFNSKLYIGWAEESSSIFQINTAVGQ